MSTWSHSLSEKISVNHISLQVPEVPLKHLLMSLDPCIHKYCSQKTFLFSPVFPVSCNPFQDTIDKIPLIQYVYMKIYDLEIWH